MAKRTTLSPARGPAPRAAAATESPSLLVPDSLRDAPVLDLMCSHFVLTLAARQGGRFNLRRDLGPLLCLSGRHLVWPVGVLQRLRHWLERRCGEQDGWQGQAQLDTAAFMARHGGWRGLYEEDSLFFHLDDYAKAAPKDLLAVLNATGEWLAQALRDRHTLVEHNIATLGDLLQLNLAERAVLLYGTLARYQRDLRSMLVEFKVHNAPEAYAFLAEVAGVDAAELADALRAGGRLERIGLVENPVAEHHITDLADLMKVSEKLPPILMRAYPDPQALMSVFTRPAPATALAADDFAFVRQDLELLSALLANAVATREPGVNVLVYGPPGTGKTELARVVARHAGLDLYEVEHADRDGQALSGRDRYRSLQIAQGFLKSLARAVLLFDEVEDVFPAPAPGAVGVTSVGGKAWVNQTLEGNPVPTVWITNRIDQIDPAFRRRFAYHLELKSPPPGARERLVRKALQDVPVDEALVARLVERPGLTPAQIHTAVRFARLAHTDAAPQGLSAEALIERQLGHADHALGRPLPTPEVAGGAGRALPYRLEWLHTESRHSADRIVQALRQRGRGSLCFHGAPGSGKTALAEHIARALQRPLMVRQASDLLGKYVGETEQQMAAMFREAEAEHAVLLLDEADSFLLDRRDAQRTHEISEVNEMLQGMERHAGVFICTTNLFDRIDQAALRRFDFKVRFLPLRPEHRLALFAQLVSGRPEPLADDEVDAWVPAALRPRLARLDAICLGDFAAVARQAECLQERWTAEQWLAQLEDEHRLKPAVRESRPVGFVH